MLDPDRLQQALAAYYTDEGVSAVAARLGTSPNTLRPIWIAEFGAVPCKERGRRIQAQAAAAVCRANAQRPKVYTEVSVACSRCGASQTFKANQTAQMDRAKYVCAACQFDRACPVCGQGVDGERGLATHLRWRREAHDASHIQYEAEVEAAPWADKTEGVDYVRCLDCGVRSATLARHLKAEHGITAVEYRARHGASAMAGRLVATGGTYLAP